MNFRENPQILVGRLSMNFRESPFRIFSKISFAALDRERERRADMEKSSGRILKLNCEYGKRNPNNSRCHFCC
jgi:hypothetical protein